MDDLIEKCQRQGLRKTKALQCILQALADAPLPVSLAELETDEQINAICDRTTIFRTLQRLESVGLLRRLNFAERGARFTLKTDHSHSEYLICNVCGRVEALDIACPVRSLEADLTERLGFRSLQHELTFYGVCPTCSESAN